MCISIRKDSPVFLGVLCMPICTGHCVHIVPVAKL